MKKYLFLLLIFLSTSNAINISGCAASTFDSYIELVKGPLGILIFSTVLVLALIYMLATGFNKVEYLIIAKDEFFHLGVSIVLLLSFGLVMESGCGIIGSAFDFAYQNMSKVGDQCYLPTGSVQEIATCSMQIMEDDATGLINTYTKQNIDFQMDASAYISYFGITGGVTLGPQAHQRTWAIFVDNVKNMFTIPAYLSIRAQNIFIRFFLGTSDTAGVIIQYLLPAAFLFRFFPPLRQIGNMMIAFAAAIFIIIPFFVALNGIMYLYTFTPDECVKYSALIDDKVLGGCSLDTNILKVARLYPQAFLLPNLIIVIFITFISSINKAFKVLG